MFGLFKKKSADGYTHNKLANESTIEATFENGRYSGFLIFLPVTKSVFSDVIVSAEDMQVFVARVEERIGANDFEPDLAKMNYERGDPPLTHDYGKSAAMRGVLDKDSQVVFRWNC